MLIAEVGYISSGTFLLATAATVALFTAVVCWKREPAERLIHLLLFNVSSPRVPSKPLRHCLESQRAMRAAAAFSATAKTQWAGGAAPTCRLPGREESKAPAARKTLPSVAKST